MDTFIYLELLQAPAKLVLMKKPSVKIHLSKHALLSRHLVLHTQSVSTHKYNNTHVLSTITHTYTHAFPVAEFKVTAAAVSPPVFHPGSSYPPAEARRSTPAPAPPLCGEADAAALHTDLQAVRRLAAGVHDAAVHVAGAAAVVAQVVGAAAAAAGLRGAGAARGLRRHHVAERQELAEEAGQDAVDAAVLW